MRWKGRWKSTQHSSKREDEGNEKDNANIIPTLRIGKRMTSPRDLFLEWMNHQVGKNI